MGVVCGESFSNFRESLVCVDFLKEEYGGVKILHEKNLFGQFVVFGTPWRAYIEIPGKNTHYYN